MKSIILLAPVCLILSGYAASEVFGDGTFLFNETIEGLTLEEVSRDLPSFVVAGGDSIPEEEPSLEAVAFNYVIPEDTSFESLPVKGGAH